MNLQNDIVKAARRAEAAGYTSLWTYERVLFPIEPRESYFGQPWQESQQQAADPLAVLTAAAVVTTKARLGTAVLVAPAHAPFQLAKSLATIDQISGGRLIAGLGSGWSTDELQATGTTRADRGRFVDELLDVFDAVWGPDPVTYRGRRAVIENALVLPKPVSKIPVMFGGGATASTLKRIATRSDGWLSVADAGGLEATARTWNEIRDLAAQHGRDVDRMEHIVVGNVTFTPQPQGRDRVPFIGTFDEVVEDIATAIALGADEVIIDLNLQKWFTDTGRMLDTAEELLSRARDEVPGSLSP
ncbi:LLM class F420-dependent oxidoreductase [Pseudonocardia sp. CA-142604]|uniref:LLM class F420-dependent oxidoreductase n=1 Tax=Pseudonocardia sp. CA-142604 TaxID=3240024 RepID=UPI003D8D507F